MSAFARFLAILFTIIFSFQNSFLLYLRLKEGKVFLEALLSQISLFFGIGLIWMLYLLTRRFAKYQVLYVFLMGIMLMVVYEIILPISPSKAYVQLMQQKSAENIYQ